MRKLLRIVPIVVIFAGAALIFERPAYGYTDPGTGLLAIQAVGSMVVAAGWYLRGKINRLLRRGTKSKSEPEIHSTVKEPEGSSLP
jgi:hypothetical protein